MVVSGYTEELFRIQTGQDLVRVWLVCEEERVIARGNLRFLTCTLGWIVVPFTK